MGDHPHDMEMAKKAGATATYLLTGHGKKHRRELTEISRPDFIAGDIYEATAWVMENFNEQEVGNG
jgi:phosphoglycolate phosphatase-like HAD superfamily hydrolase